MAVPPREPARSRSHPPSPPRPGTPPSTGLHPGERPDRATRYRSTGELVRRAADGDHAAWRGVVEQYGDLVWSVVRGFRLDEAHAADAVQTTWLRLLENVEAIREPERLAGWLRTTARRACLEGISRAGRERPADPQDRASGAGVERACERVDGDPEASLLHRERVGLVRSAVSDLPERSQRLLELLVASPPLSYAEIGARLGMPVGSIGPTRARLLARLRTTLAAADLADAA